MSASFLLLLLEQDDKPNLNFYLGWKPSEPDGEPTVTNTPESTDINEIGSLFVFILFCATTSTSVYILIYLGSTGVYIHTFHDESAGNYYALEHVHTYIQWYITL